jgi:hypothetical protein
VKQLISNPKSINAIFKAPFIEIPQYYNMEENHKWAQIMDQITLQCSISTTYISLAEGRKQVFRNPLWIQNLESLEKESFSPTTSLIFRVVLNRLATCEERKLFKKLPQNYTKTLAQYASLEDLATDFPQLADVSYIKTALSN